jgi:hypothetical protein
MYILGSLSMFKPKGWLQMNKQPSHLIYLKYVII